MFNLIWADLFKMRKSTAMKVILGITTLSAVIMTVFAYLIPQGKMDAGMTGIGFMFSDINMISILGAVIAGFFICGDYENKTIHAAVACGCSRKSIVVSKAVVFIGAIIVALIPYAVVTGIAIGSGETFSLESVGVGFLNLMAQESGGAFEATAFFKLLLVMLAMMIVYGAQLSICVPLALGIKKPVFVIAIYYGITILSAQLIGLRGSSDLFDKVFACTPFGGEYIFLTTSSKAGDIVQAILVSAIFTAVMLAIAYGLFRKAELK